MWLVMLVMVIGFVLRPAIVLSTAVPSTVLAMVTFARMDPDSSTTPTCGAAAAAGVTLFCWRRRRDTTTRQ